MSKRNFTLLIIILIIITLVILVLFSFSKGPTPNNPGEDTNFFSNFNPFNKNKTTTPGDETPADISGYEPDNTIPENIKLKKVSSMPIAGYGVFVKERYKEVPPPEINTEAPQEKTKKPTPPATEFVTALRYVDMATGNIYQTFADKINEQKFSSTVIPKIHEAIFGSKAESVVMRYLANDDLSIQTFTGSLPKELLGADSSILNEIKGSFLPDNITSISVSPDLTKIFYLFETEEGSAVGVTAGVSGTTKTQIFSSPFSEWLSDWPTTNLITLTTKPSGLVPGYVYALNPTKKSFTKILGDINGLTTLTNPNGKSILYSNNTLSLNIFTIGTKNITPLGVNTLSDKCTWSKASIVVYCAVPTFTTQAVYPDDWYKGKISFSDNIWKINTSTGETTLISDPYIVAGEDIDGIKLILDKDEKYLFFVNKKDSFLWELELE